MKISELTSFIDREIPVSGQCEWDNSGVNISACGDLTGVVVCLDVTKDVIDKCVELGYNFILSHHPIIFRPLASIDDGYVSRIVRAAIKNDVCVYSAHTSADNMLGGLNDYVADLIGIQNVEVLSQEGGRVGDIRPTTVKMLGDRVADILNDSHTRIVGDRSKVIERVSIVNGAGGRSEDLLYVAMRRSDIMISAEYKYSSIRLACDMGYPIIETGHYNSECPFIDWATKILNKIEGLKVYKYITKDPYKE